MPKRVPVPRVKGALHSAGDAINHPNYSSQGSLWPDARTTRHMVCWSGRRSVTTPGSCSWVHWWRPQQNTSVVCTWDGSGRDWIQPTWQILEPPALEERQGQPQMGVGSGCEMPSSFLLETAAEQREALHTFWHPVLYLKMKRTPRMAYENGGVE